MNIFVLDTDPYKCATYHCDQHVLKMLIEYSQIFCTVYNEYGFQSEMKPTHTNHPCVKWAKQSINNLEWLWELNFHLHNEWRFRWDHDLRTYHKAYTKFLKIDTLALYRKINIIDRTPFPLCMPDYCKVLNEPVKSYRNYYVNEKIKFATWTKRKKPKWFLEKLM